MLFILPIIIVLLTLFYMYIEANRNRVNAHEIELDMLPDSFHNFKMFFISDVHRRLISDLIIEKANEAEVVIIGGDLAEKGVPIERIKANLLKLSKIAPVYFVWGNNDYEIDHRIFKKTINDCGVHILDNSSVLLQKGIKTIDLAAINDLSLKKANLKETLSGCSSECRILISHNPAIMKKINKDDDINLVLSGHTHGGQIRLGPFGIAKKGGWYFGGSCPLFISNGYGTRHLPLRFGAQSETNMITLKQAKSLQ
jgi:predicted MPP superfamily phosphohydrolase